MDREQVGGDHYRTPAGIPEHWDIAWALGWDFFQYQITKYIWRWKDKGGVEDLKKARHFFDKYLLLVEEKEKRGLPPGYKEFGAEPGPGYVNQDPDFAPPRADRGPTSADSPAVASVGRGVDLNSSFIWINGHMYQRVK